MRTLDTALDGASAGPRQVVVLSGEAGIGKSRLVAELARRADQRRTRVAWGRAWESGGAPVLWPWVQVLRSTVDHPQSPSARQALGDAMAVIDGLLGAGPGDSPEESRFTLFDAIDRFLASLAATEPLVVIVEDLHAADEPSVELFRFLASSTTAGRLLLVGTHRPSAADEHVDRLLPDLSREGKRLALVGLTAEECRDLLVAAGRAEATAVDTAELHRATGGNPLFVQEVARLAAHGDGPNLFDEGISGADIGSAIRRRVSLISDDTVRVLGAAAVLGRSFDTPTLLEISGLPAEVVRPALARAAGEGLLRLAPDRDEATFTHDLVRRALYDDLDEATRRDLHAAAATAVSERDPGAVQLVAHHAVSAGPAHRQEAVALLVQAGNAAIAHFGFETGARHFERALDLLPSGDDVGRCDLLIRLGEARRRADPGSERDVLMEAAQLARAAGDGDRLAQVLLTLSQLKMMVVLVPDDEMVQLLEDAINTMPPGDPGRRAALLADLAKELVDPADRERRAALVREARAVAEETGDHALLAEVALGRCLAGGDEMDEGLRDLGRALEGLRGEGAGGYRVVELGLSFRRFRCTRRLEQGDRTGFEEDAGYLTRFAEERPYPSYRWYAAMTAVTRASVLGEWHVVERLAKAAAAVMPGDLLAAIVHMAQRSVALHHQRRAAEELDAIEKMAAAIPAGVGMHAMAAFAHLEQGNDDVARSIAARVLSDPAAVPDSIGWLPFMVTFARLARDLGDTKASLAIYDLLLPLRSRHAVLNAGQPALYFGPVELALGLCASTLGRDDDAVAHLEAATAQAVALGALGWEAEARAELAVVLARHRSAQRDRADTLLAEARRMAESLDLTALLHRIDASSPRSPSGELRLARSGDSWALSWPGGTTMVRHTRGLEYLAQLLSHPDVEVAAPQLLSGGATAPPQAAHELSSGRGEASHALLDDQAKQEYLHRVRELQAEIDEAAGASDTERESRARLELDFLLEELQAAAGLGGRARQFSTADERARVSVTKSIRRGIDRIGDHAPGVASYLSDTVSTGMFCCFRPDPAHPHFAPASVEH